MKISYTFETINTTQTSIFLAGGTIRTQDLKTTPLKSWRQQVIEILKDLQFNGTIYVPQYRNGKLPQNWTLDQQIKWESKALHSATVILFWIPRNLKHLPCFTTNFQLGEWFKSEKVIVGAPPQSEKNDYLKWKCINQAKLKWHNDITDIAISSLKLISKKLKNNL